MISELIEKSSHYQQFNIQKHIKELKEIPAKQRRILRDQNAIAKLSRRHAHFGSFLYLGRGVNYPSALEGALKLKEISYIPAEGYAAGEMKHGPIALIDKGMPVLAIATSSKVLNLVASNIEEAKARGAQVIAIVDEGSREQIKASKYIVVPRTLEILSPLINVVPLQMFAYFIALAKKCDIDKPRNLAKSVTVR